MRTFFEDVALDLRHAWRLLRRARGFTIAAIAVLAMCIGANTAVFSVVNSLLLRPLPYPDVERIVQVVITHDPSRSNFTLDTSIPKFIAWKQSVRVFSHLAAYQAADPGVNLFGVGPPEHLSALHVSQDYFGVYGTRALHGRTFKSQEDRPHGPHVVVLGYGFWQRRFGGDPSVIGRALPLGGASCEIVGVLAGTFRPDPAVDVYLPLKADPFSLDFANMIRVVGRTYPNVTVAERDGPEIFPRAHRERELLREELRRVRELSAGPLRAVRSSARLRAATGGLAVARTRTMDEIVGGPARRAAFHVTLMTTFAVVALLLAIVGFYGLMSYSVQQRTQEIGIRMALGAIPADVRNMVLWQGLRLAGAGVVFGVGAALMLTRVMVSLVFGVETYDPVVFAGVALLLSVVALLAALVPAHRATRVNPLDAVRGG